MRKAILASIFIVVAVLSGAPVYASCGPPTALGHLNDSYFICGDSGPIVAYAYELDAPSVGTGPIKISCSAFDGVLCTGSSGVVGDNKVTIESDWSNVGISGCPVDPSTGGKRVMLVVQCADGQGLMVSLSGHDGGLAYTIEAAQPFDGSVSSPVAAGPLSTRPKVTGSAATSAGSVNLTLHFENPKSPTTPFYSDCDANTLGAFLGTTCPDAFDKNAFLTRAQYGNVWKSTQACGNTPDPTATKWTDTGVLIPATGGDVAVSALLPTAVTDCLYFGGELNLGFPRVTGQPFGIAGTVQVGGQTVAPPKADNLKASSAAGKVTISWSSTNEIGLGVFKVLAISKSKGELELTSVSPRGNGGSASYSVTLGMGDFKGAKTVIVRSILTDGSKVDSAAVNF